MTRSRPHVRATVWTLLWAVPAVVFVLIAAAQWIGLDPARDIETAVAALVFATACGAVARSGVAYHRRVDRMRRLPESGSSAREPMRRLAEVEPVVEALLDQLDDERLPPGWVDHTRYAIANTSYRLREIAHGIKADERALDRAKWRWERETHAEGAIEMLDRLNRCLDGYDRLVAALGHAIASAEVPSLDELTEATEHLAGLEQALREL